METRARVARSCDNGAERNVAPQPVPGELGLPTIQPVNRSAREVRLPREGFAVCECGRSQTLCWSATLRELRCSCFPPRGRVSLYVLDGCGFWPFAVADLLRREQASADTATPARRCRVCNYWHRLLIGASGSYQFATALWTRSLNHELLREKRSSLSAGLVARMDRPSLFGGKPGRIAVAVSLQTSRVIPLMLGVRQCLGFSDTEFGIVTSILPVLASREVALMF